jgi:hypothetical protein
MTKISDSDSTREGSVNFTTLADALRHCSAELRAGRCAIVWPTDSAGYRVAAWSFENHLDQPDHATFAPTVPQGLEEMPGKRQRSLLGSWGVRRGQ